ncbi:MAG TPA: DUF2585 family protein [Pyrinomonadaceae bacterium]|jgi:hypothetical protein
MSPKKTENKPDSLFSFNSAGDYLPWLLMSGAVVVMVFQLFYQGRVWWCRNDAYTLWSGAVLSRHNSQHLFDPYTLTHILHGVLYFWIATLIFRRMPLVWRLFLAILVECSWEVLENTNMVIERYRAVTISLDYFGDSIANSLGDVLSCTIGFLIAQKIKLWWSLAFFIITELILLFWIHDSLLLNIVMLVYPIEAVKTWQMNL